jgi:hypothetical protein
MMNNDEEELQKARAQHLREQLERLKSGQVAGEQASENPGPARESPRDFIQRRMRQIARAWHKTKTSEPDHHQSSS